MRATVIGLFLIGLIYSVIAYSTSKNVGPATGNAIPLPLINIDQHSEAIYRAETFPQVNHGNFALYEDVTPLGRAILINFAGKRFVIFSASDSSDPRISGRIYWMVAR